MRTTMRAWCGCALVVTAALAVTGAAEGGTPDRGVPPARPMEFRAASDVAPRLQALAQAYEQSGGGAIKVRVERDAADLAGACAADEAPVVVLARDLTEGERGSGLRGEAIARDAVVFVVSTDQPANSLSRDELRRVWSGEAAAWADGTDIVLFDQRVGAAARETIARSLLGRLSISPESLVKPESALMDALERNPRAIGYAFLSAVSGDLKVLGVDGVWPTSENIRTGLYPFARPLVLVTRGPASGEAAKFVEFMRSEDGMAALSKASLAPASPVGGAVALGGGGVAER